MSSFSKPVLTAEEARSYNPLTPDGGGAEAAHTTVSLLKAVRAKTSWATRKEFRSSGLEV
jgi:hypothetical protein